MSDESVRILALIPAYNEAAHIANVVAGALAHLPVLVVDDGSTDETSAQAEAAGAAVLRRSPNQGKGAALRAGFRHALAKDYDAVLTLDADVQHDPAEIPRFLQAYAVRRADLIIGQRDFDQIPPVRRLANWLGRVTFSWALGQSIPDNQSGYRLISRRLMEAILTSDEQGFEYEVEMIVTCVRRGFVLDWVPIRTIYAGETSHINPIQHIKSFLRVVWRTRQSRTGSRTGSPRKGCQSYKSWMEEEPCPDQNHSGTANTITSTIAATTAKPCSENSGTMHISSGCTPNTSNPSPKHTFTV